MSKAIHMKPEATGFQAPMYAAVISMSLPRNLHQSSSTVEMGLQQPSDEADLGCADMGKQRLDSKTPTRIPGSVRTPGTAVLCMVNLRPPDLFDRWQSSFAQIESQHSPCRIPCAEPSSADNRSFLVGAMQQHCKVA